MVLAMCCHIIFAATDKRPEINIYRCTSVNIESSWKNQTATATIVLPRNIKDFDKQKVKEVFRRGDAVTIKLGYNGTLTDEYKGYIISATADIPVTIKCQDEMWKLKQLPANVSMKDCSLPDLIKKIAPGYKTDVAEYQIGAVRYAQTTVAEVLKKLQEDFNFYSYFDGSTLIVGKEYSDNAETVAYSLDRVVKDNLTYKSKDEKKVLVVATSTLSNGTKIKAEYGDKGGEKRELSHFGISDKEALKKLAKLDYDKYMIDGFEGNIEVFGTPFIKHGTKLDLTSDLYPEKTGLYYSDAVKTKWEKALFHRTIDVGKKVTA